MIGNMRGDEETKNKLVEWKALVATMGIKNADLKDQFFNFLIFCLELLGRLKCLATGLDASLSFLSTSRRFLEMGHLVVFLFIIV